MLHVAFGLFMLPKAAAILPCLSKTHRRHGRPSMPEFIYCFGYETPRQARNNDRHGWDDENSHGLTIRAESEEGAMRWGREVAERFIQLLLRDESISWKALGFADWIEVAGGESRDMPVVQDGEYPDYAPWLREQADDA
ncbi:hypothetical protein [Paludisphaera mucosa]|uniref:Uncharacterized protein n=1 Tax=Paludisphaera mucosa TaxID=3030827 RepID=A0ABT6F3Z1_9BACT|nr:hypothetical protein [Paludisphaera mucosa]MDG3002303.1 hypothetical protein [Paludisphaera mucosa]